MQDPENVLNSTKLYDVAILAIWESLYKEVLQYLSENAVESSSSSEAGFTYEFVSEEEEEQEEEKVKEKLPEWIISLSPPTVTKRGEVVSL
jgi:hypothetical protein